MKNKSDHKIVKKNTNKKQIKNPLHVDHKI